MPNEVLALGTRIVRELELQPSVDTLSRWMAHHLAEIMLVAERAEGTERDTAREKAADLILRLWARRNELPGQVNPLKELGDVIAVLRRLRSDAWPYRRPNAEKLDQLLSQAFDGLRHLVAHGVLLTGNAVAERVELAEASEFISSEEKEVIDAINEWIEFYQDKNVYQSNIRIVSLEKESELKKIEEKMDILNKMEPISRARALLIMEIDSLNNVLTNLKLELEGRKLP